jgi:hypothetical protein
LRNRGAHRVPLKSTRIRVGTSPALQRLLGLLKPCLCEIDVCYPDVDFLHPRAVQRPQIKRFGCRQVRFASLKLALSGTALDPNQMLATAATMTRPDQAKALQPGEGVGVTSTDPSTALSDPAPITL